MQELEKILEEIEDLQDISGWDLQAFQGILEIIHKHMNGGWIPVEERLPKVAGDIDDDNCPEFNVTIDGAGKATTLKCSSDGTFFDDNGYVYPVIAWQPLPEPYRPERSDNERK